MYVYADAPPPPFFPHFLHLAHICYLDMASRWGTLGRVIFTENVPRHVQGTIKRKNLTRSSMPVFVGAFLHIPVVRDSATGISSLFRHYMFYPALPL